MAARQISEVSLVSSSANSSPLLAVKKLKLRLLEATLTFSKPFMCAVNTSGRDAEYRKSEEKHPEIKELADV